MTPHTLPFPPRRPTGSERGFSLFELLAVMGIIAIVSAITLSSLSGMRGAQEATKAATSIEGILEYARTTAMANKSYVWVGFFEENPNSPPAAGIGQLVISMVTSNDGTKLYSLPDPVSQLPSDSLIQILKLIKVSSVHLEVLTAAQVNRPSIPDPQYMVGSTGFPNGITFTYPTKPTSAPGYTFNQIIQFSPEGDATRIADLPARVIEIGLCPARGNVAVRNDRNVVALQVAGIGGQVTTYRP